MGQFLEGLKMHGLLKIIRDNPTKLAVSLHPNQRLIHTRTWKEHIGALTEWFSCMLKWGITARPLTCVFGEETVDFIWHKIGSGELGELHQGSLLNREGSEGR